MKIRKNWISVIAAAALACSAMGMMQASADDSAQICVTIADAQGKLAVVQQEITVTDADGDGALTINDALYLTHEQYYEGGAEAGYHSSVGTYGLAIDKLWGSENGGSYGYYVNHTAAMSLADPVKTGDYLDAFVYTDLTGWSDAYSWFDEAKKDVQAGEEITLTLSRAGYDADWNPVTLPVENAVISVDGNATEFVTDAEGKVTITLTDAGSHQISASSAALTLVPPVSIITVAGETTESTATETTATETTATESTTTEETQTTDTTTTTAATTSATTAATTAGTTTAASTTAASSASPKPGDASGIGFAAVLCGIAGIGSFVVARKHED